MCFIMITSQQFFNSFSTPLLSAKVPGLTLPTSCSNRITESESLFIPTSHSTKAETATESGGTPAKPQPCKTASKLKKRMDVKGLKTQRSLLFHVFICLGAFFPSFLGLKAADSVRLSTGPSFVFASSRVKSNLKCQSFLGQ